LPSSFASCLNVDLIGFFTSSGNNQTRATMSDFESELLGLAEDDPSSRKKRKDQRGQSKSKA
jgi:hypothetical protein